MLRNANVQNLFGLGALGGGYNTAVGACEILVTDDIVEQALAAVEEIRGMSEDTTAMDDSDERTEQEDIPEDDHDAGRSHPLSKRTESHRMFIGSIVLSTIWLFGIGSGLGFSVAVRLFRQNRILGLLSALAASASLLIAFLVVGQWFSTEQPVPLPIFIGIALFILGADLFLYDLWQLIVTRDNRHFVRALVGVLISGAGIALSALLG